MAAPTTPQYPKQNPAFPQYWTDGRKDVGVYNDNYLPGRFFSRRDMNLLGSVNAELFGDIVEVVVQVFCKAQKQPKSLNLYCTRVSVLFFHWQ